MSHLRRLLTLAAVCATLLVSTACGKATTDTSDPAPDSTSVPSGPGTVALRFSMVDRRISGDHTILPAVTVDRRATTATDKVAAAVLHQVEARIRAIVRGHRGLLTADGELKVTAIQRVARPGLTVIGLEGWDDTGGAHGNPVGESLVFDTRTGVRLQLFDVLDPSGYRSLIAAARPLLLERLARDGFQPDERLDKGLQEPDSITAWWPSTEGIHIVFGVYTLGGFVLGEPEVVIPWSAVEDGIATDAAIRV